MKSLSNENVGAVEQAFQTINGLKQKEDAMLGLIATAQLVNVDLKDVSFISKIVNGFDSFTAKVTQMDRPEKIQSAIKALTQMYNLPKSEQQTVITGLNVLAFDLNVNPKQIIMELNDGGGGNLGPYKPIWA